jgi:hypothetical protein
MRYTVPLVTALIDCLEAHNGIVVGNELAVVGQCPRVATASRYLPLKLVQRRKEVFMSPNICEFIHFI